MKKIFTISILAAFAVVLFTSCRKEAVVVYDDSSYWLSQERGWVVYSNNACGYYVVETNYGYTIIRNLDGLRTYENDVMYGNFGAFGIRSFYNYTADVVTRGDVVEYDLTYNEAQAAIDYYCPYGKANGLKITQSATAQGKISRPVLP
ncbi:MAG: hypothetical protein KTQ13_02500 [Ferruginibacter sp.]|mgnify:CR=1 FL=1|nr:hypothetical protein [Chitinophagaceae bacterium]MBP6287915.1 hypothetical protein [Ferruginibacter sp.]MBU9935495.1 hypothetical protein [Ferruginibacter sp.]HQY10945.1 hypothetical protein [Ferruginibacter sp.]